MARSRDAASSRVVRAEPHAVQRLGERGELVVPHLARPRAASDRGSRSPAIIASMTARAVWCPASFDTTDDSLHQGVLVR